MKPISEIGFFALSFSHPATRLVKHFLALSHVSCHASLTWPSPSIRDRFIQGMAIGCRKRFLFSAVSGNLSGSMPA